MLLAARDEDGDAAERRASCATSSSRCCSPATRRPRPRWPGPSTRCSATRTCWSGCATGRRRRRRVPRRGVEETLRVRPMVADVGRELGEPLELGGYAARRRARRVAGDLPRAPPRRRLPRAGRLPARALPRRRAPDTYAWIPFGGGMRRCLGAAFAQFEMRVAIETILRSAELAGSVARARPPGAPQYHALSRRRNRRDPRAPPLTSPPCASGGRLRLPPASCRSPWLPRRPRARRAPSTRRRSACS